jgi:hypothetical protein
MWGSPLEGREPRDWIFDAASQLADPLFGEGMVVAIEIRGVDDVFGGPVPTSSVLRAIFPSDERRSAFIADLTMQGLSDRLHFPVDVDASPFVANGNTGAKSDAKIIAAIANAWREQLGVQERISAAILAAKALGHPDAGRLQGLRVEDGAGELSQFRAWCGIAATFYGSGAEWSINDVRALSPRLRELGMAQEVQALEKYESSDFDEGEHSETHSQQSESTSAIGAVLQVLLGYAGCRSDDLPILILNHRGTIVGDGISTADVFLYVAATFGRLDMPAGLLPGYSLEGQRQTDALSELLDDMVREELSAAATTVRKQEEDRQTQSRDQRVSATDTGTGPVPTETLFANHQLEEGGSGAPSDVVQIE